MLKTTKIQGIGCWMVVGWLLDGSNGLKNDLKKLDPYEYPEFADKACQSCCSPCGLRGTAGSGDLREHGHLAGQQKCHIGPKKSSGSQLLLLQKENGYSVALTHRSNSDQTSYAI